MKERALTPQQVAFVGFLADDPKQNMTEAARRAGYKASSARAMGSELFARPGIRAAYDALVSQRCARYDVTESRILEGLAHIAFGDRRKIRQCSGTRVTITPSDQWWPEDADMVRDVEWKDTEDGPRQISRLTFESRTEALLGLAKIKGMLREKVDVSVDARFSNAAQWAKDTLEELFQRREEAKASTADEDEAHL